MDECIMCNKRKWFGKYENNKCDKCNILDSIRKQSDKMMSGWKSVNSNHGGNDNNYSTHTTTTVTSNIPESTSFVTSYYSVFNNSDDCSSSGDSHCNNNHVHSSHSYDSHSSCDSSSNDSSSDCSCDCGGCD